MNKDKNDMTTSLGVAPTLAWNLSIIEKIAQISSKGITCVKNAENPYYNSKYVDLPAVVDALRPSLEMYNLMYAFNLEMITEDVIEAKEGEQKIAPKKSWYLVLAVYDKDKDKDNGSRAPVINKFPIVNTNTPQEFGKGITYAKRYLLSTVFNIIALDEDDDGNTASGIKTTSLQRKSPVEKKAPQPLSSADINKQVNDEIPTFF